jgi:Helix-destabilising protein
MKFEIQIEIKSTEVHDKRGTSRQGKPFHIREQFGYLELGKPYPVEIRISLEEAAPPYPPGRYVIDPSCLYVDRYGQLALGRLRLVPVQELRAARA